MWDIQIIRSSIMSFTNKDPDDLPKSFMPDEFYTKEDELFPKERYEPEVHFKNMPSFPSKPIKIRPPVDRNLRNQMEKRIKAKKYLVV